MKIYFVESFAIVLVLTTVIVTGDLRRGGRCTQNKKKSPEGRFLPDLERDRDKFDTAGLNPYNRYVRPPTFRHLPFGIFEDLRPFLRSGRCTQNKRKSPEGRFLPDLERDRDKFDTAGLKPYNRWVDPPIFRFFPFYKYKELQPFLRSGRCTQNKRKSPEGRFLPDLERDKDKFSTPGLKPYSRYFNAPKFKHLPFGSLQELHPFLRRRRSTQNKKKCPKGRSLQNLEGDRDTPCLNPYRRCKDAPKAGNILFGRKTARKVCARQGGKCPKGRCLQGPIGGRNRFDPAGINPDARFLHNPNAHIPGSPSDIPLPDSRFLQDPIGGRNRFDPAGINPDARFLHNPNEHIPGSPSDIPLPDSMFLQGPIEGRNRFDPAGINPDARFLHNPNEHIPGSPSDIPLPDSRFLQGPIGGRNRFDPAGINPDARFLHNPNEHIPGSPSDIPLPDSRFLQGPIGSRNRFDPAGINPDARFLHNPNEHIPGSPRDY